MAVLIRLFQENDWPHLWPILRTTFSRGDTYTYTPDASEAQIRSAWTRVPAATYVACDEAGRMLGSYYIKANQPGHGDHVGNCGYVVAESARGEGVGSLMCEHSQGVALALGFVALQFNFVVSTNTSAVRLWQKNGFDIVGRLPRAFRHPEEGLVDALVMYKWLVA